MATPAVEVATGKTKKGDDARSVLLIPMQLRTARWYIIVWFATMLLIPQCGARL
jgi:hypothetical protein